MERIDKILASVLNISRADAKALVKKSRVFVNGKAVRDVGFKVNPNGDDIRLDGKSISYEKYVYIMMNKPKGVISATKGGDKTVLDIVPEEMARKNLFPAGRLDKDTTGFMLITDDGDFAHRILSPKNHIPKTYIALLDKPFDNAVISEFERGVELGDENCMPAELSCVDGDFKKAMVVIRQGMYHQIKRMFKHFGLKVIRLERIKMGGLMLDENLGFGECRYLTKEELYIIEHGS